MKRLVLLFVITFLLPINVFAFNFDHANYILNETMITEDVNGTTTTTMYKDEKVESIEKNDIVENVIEESQDLFEYFKEDEGKRLLIEIVLVAIDVIILIIIIVKIKNHKLNKQLDDL